MFTLNETNSAIFEILLDYFSGHINHATTGMNPDKGLLLFGAIGCGKTFFMNLFRRNSKCTYVIRSCSQVSYEYSTEGFPRIEFYSNHWKTYRNEFGQTSTGICFDDLGTETDRKHFGDNLNVMGEIIMNRYRNRELWKQTFITTNLTGKQISEAYGERLTSRIFEMFNILKFPANPKDWRKENIKRVL